MAKPFIVGDGYCFICTVTDKNNLYKNMAVCQDAQLHITLLPFTFHASVAKFQTLVLA